MLLYGEPREHLRNPIYRGIFMGENIQITDSRNGQHDDLPLIQLEPANNEFGFFKGELLTYPYSTQKADFNFVKVLFIAKGPSSLVKEVSFAKS